MTKTSIGYPHMIPMKEVLRKRFGCKRLGSKDCGVKNLTAVGETRWQQIEGGVRISDPFYDQAANVLNWLTEHCNGAWRYGAQYREIRKNQPAGSVRILELRHRVQFENTSDAILFKLSYNP